MKYENKRLKIWLILSPIFIISIIVGIAYLLLTSYQNDFFKKLEHSSAITTSELVKNSLEKKVASVVNEDNVIFDGSNNSLDEKRLISYFSTSLNPFGI